MILILAENFSPRLAYVVQVLFGQILQTKYKIAYISSAQNALEIIENEDVKIVINYTGFHIKGSVKIPRSKLLFQTDIRKIKPALKVENNLLQIHFADEDLENAGVQFDIFSAAFYLLTEYHNYTAEKFDGHERYLESENPFLAGNYHTKPWVNIYAEFLWQKLYAANQNLQRTKHTFNYQVTFDIDDPFLYKHRPLWLQFSGLIKDLLRFDKEAVKTRLRVLNGTQKDPYNVYDYILEKVEVQKLLFFFLIDRNSKYDGRFTYKNVEYQTLIKNLAALGVAIGIHPSYTSFLNEEKIKFEKEQLEAFFGKHIYAARMHFLKYRLPQTYQYFVNNTILHDYSACPVHKPGFIHGMAIPFPWFNLAENKVTNLTIHPTQVMDRTLQKYMALKPEEAILEIKKIIGETAAVNGTFTMLYHNSTLSDYKEWQGWRPVFEESLRYLQQKCRS